MIKPFQAVAGATIKITASTTATAVTGTNGVIPEDSRTVVISNTDAAIIVFVRLSPANAPSVAVADVDMPVLPGQQVRVSCVVPSRFSIVAASGTPVVYVTPGAGN